MKYQIKKILNKKDIENIYSKLIIFSPQKNIFCSSEILNFFFEDLELYTLSKNDKIKSFVYLLKDSDNAIISDPFIYSGIINHPRLLMKNSRYNNEIFKINELIVNEIFSNYKNIDINLPLNFKDMRPFLWFNYGKNENVFKVTPRYTSILNINNKNDDEILNEIDDVKRRDIKKVLNDENYKVSEEIDLPLMKKFYIETMQRNNGEFDNIALEKIFNFMDLQSKNNKIIQTTTYFKEDPLYSVLFLHDDISSCYLYGSGNIQVKNRYAGSLALWRAIQISMKKELLYIDLEGINSPFRGEYKLCMGGEVNCYFNIKLI